LWTRLVSPRSIEKGECHTILDWPVHQDAIHQGEKRQYAGGGGPSPVSHSYRDADEQGNDAYQE
jgi:hypothetical protein